MTVWRFAFHLEFDPSTAGITGFHQQVEGRLADAVTIARTNETTTYSAITVTSGRPADRRVWYGGAGGPGEVGHLIFPSEPTDLLAELFDMTADPPTFLFPDAVLAAGPGPDVSRSFVIYHVCDHDDPDPTPCVPAAEWHEP